jgi:hypothetical protein
MVNKTTLEDKIDALTSIVEKGFGAVAGDIASINERMATLATKEQITTLHTQVASIETQLRDATRHKPVTRVADLEEKVFGAACR